MGDRNYMVLLIFIIPLVFLICFSNANFHIFMAVAVISLIFAVAGNGEYLVVDLVGLFIVFGTIVIYRLYNAIPRLTQEQKEEQERKKREEELVRQKQAATLASMRRRAFNFGLLTMFFVFIADIVIRGYELPESSHLIPAIIAGGLAYVIRLIYLVGQDPEVNLKEDICVALILIVVPNVMGVIWFGPAIMLGIYGVNIFPIYSNIKPSHFQEVPIASIPSYIPYSKVTTKSRSPSVSKSSVQKKQVSRPNVDLRHCIDLNSDIEIARCAE